MPASGRKPNTGQAVRHRVKPVHDWSEVDAVPFEGAPSLTGRPSKAVAQWWAAISTMPHCVLWDASDWQFAMDTSRIAAAFYRGNLKVATELRQREKIMGTTVDARRDLRIRYVPPAIEAPAGVTAIDEYRDRLTR